MSDVAEAKGAEAPIDMTIACLGASITRGQGTFDWISELSSRPQNRGFSFLNFGVGGDPAYAALRRLRPVVNAHPDVVLVALGWNDIVMLVFPNVRRYFEIWKRLPRQPSPEWFRESTEEIVYQINTQTLARIGRISLSQMGEDPESTDPVQHELNLRFAEYSRIIKQIADENGLGYIPFYEAMHDQIVSCPGKAFTCFRFLPMYRNAFRQYVLRRDLDAIAQNNGWRFHVDGLHLNSRGGMILADHVQEYLDSLTRGRNLGDFPSERASPGPM